MDKNTNLIFSMNVPEKVPVNSKIFCHVHLCSYKKTNPIIPIGTFFGQRLQKTRIYFCGIDLIDRFYHLKSIYFYPCIKNLSFYLNVELDPFNSISKPRACYLIKFKVCTAISRKWHEPTCWYTHLVWRFRLVLFPPFLTLE